MWYDLWLGKGGARLPALYFYNAKLHENVDTPKLFPSFFRTKTVSEPPEPPATKILRAPPRATHLAVQNYFVNFA